MKKPTIRFSVNSEQNEIIKRYAMEHGISASALASFALFNYITRNSKKYKMLLEGFLKDEPLPNMAKGQK